MASIIAEEHNVYYGGRPTASERQSCSVVEIARFEPTPPPFDAPVGVVSLEFRRDFWHRKTRVTGLSYAILSVILGLAVSVQLRLVTDRRADGWTDRQTDRHTMTANTALAWSVVRVRWPILEFYTP